MSKSTCDGARTGRESQLRVARRRRGRPAWLSVLACSLLAACASAPAQRSGAATSTTPAVETTPAIQPVACGSGATAFWLPGPGGGRLEANSIGSGPVAAVFLHQFGGSGMCGFFPYATWLTSHYPVRAILVNRCGYGASRCPSYPQGDSGTIAQTGPAVDWARAHGAIRVALVGASYGGGDAVQAAGVIAHVGAVVDLSGAGNDAGVDDAVDARRLQVPALFAVAPADRDCPLYQLQTLYALVPAHPKKFVVVNELPGIHGWDLLADLNGQPLRLAPLVASWIMAATTGSAVP
jgi:pimeloyl-ACP methyl ester carboxylesterase